MIFNSFEYFVFLPVVLALYFVLPHNGQNRMLLIASYFFYGWWDWRFLSLILLSTVVDYTCGNRIHGNNNEDKRRLFLYISIATNLTILGFFKYWNFFTDSLVLALSPLGVQLDAPTLNVILPVGISFYTFQTMTYSIDIYRRKLNPSRSFFDFALFVSFFPQLVAGPIERAKNLLPQIEKQRTFNAQQFLDGGALIFFGLFKKVFIADNLGIIVDGIYGSPDATSAEYIVATFAFAFQIYGDFSGYSDIARGTAKLLGINLMVNFNQPYLASNPSDLWRRWHISLSSWLRDYLYFPLGGSRKGKNKTYRNLMLTMILGGLWHGAAWNYVLWGVYHGMLLSGYRILGFSDVVTTYEIKNIVKHSLNVLLMFILVCGSWVLFRAESFSQIIYIYTSILFNPWDFYACVDLIKSVAFYTAIPITQMLYFYLKDFKLFGAKGPGRMFENPPFKSFYYGALLYLLVLYGTSSQSFIYFQF